MIKALTLALTLGAAEAFTTAPVRGTRSVMKMGAETMEGVIKPTGFFDPLGLSKLGSDSTNAWFRQAEIKHGRVAMFAFVGYIVQCNGIHLPGDIATGTSFESISQVKPLEAWAAVPALGQLQIISFLGCFEILTEMEKPHYMKGGKPGVVPFLFASPQVPAFSEEKKADLRLKELQNGRLAMIGIMGFFAASSMPGSVPSLAAIF